MRGNPALTAVYLGSTPPKQDADVFTASPNATVSRSAPNPDGAT
jgi:hypothetical protein